MLAGHKREEATMTMLNDHCSVERREHGIAWLTITNAGKANILGSPVIAALASGIDALAKEADLRALVLTGSGETSFIGGADIGEMAALDPAAAERFITGLRDLCEAARRFPAPVAARINGWCLGGGLELAMACDFRIAADTAKFAMPEVKVGIPSVIHAALMPRLIGMARARWLILTGATIDAATARDWGLVDLVAPAAALDAAVEAALRPVVACGPAALRAQKELLRAWEELPLSQAIDASIPVFGRAFGTGEPQAHMQAFLERKR